MFEGAPRVAAACLTRAVECELVSPREAISWLDMEARGHEEFFGLARKLSVYGDTQLSSFLVDMAQKATGSLMDMQDVASQVLQLFNNEVGIGVYHQL